MIVGRGCCAASLRGKNRVSLEHFTPPLMPSSAPVRPLIAARRTSGSYVPVKAVATAHPVAQPALPPSLPLLRLFGLETCARATVKGKLCSRNLLPNLLRGWRWKKERKKGKKRSTIEKSYNEWRIVPRRSPYNLFIPTIQRWGEGRTSVDHERTERKREERRRGGEKEEGKEKRGCSTYPSRFDLPPPAEEGGWSTRV